MSVRVIFFVCFSLTSCSIVSLMHEVGEEYSNLLERFAKLPHNADAKVNSVLAWTFGCSGTKLFTG